MEKERLRLLAASDKPEFVAVYGRRRVGKTYLVREYFDDIFAFRVTGIEGAGLTTQLENFKTALDRHGLDNSVTIGNWFMAFERLRDLLEADKRKSHNRRSRNSKPKQVVFIDEMPWLDTPRSGFLPALEHFWNSWASGQPQIMLIVCGSATTWIKNKLLENYGGLYNRITAQFHLKPFTLAECEEYYRSMDMAINRMQVIQGYMVFGGIPHYMSLMNPTYSIDRNIDLLCFRDGAELGKEFNRVFASLFRDPDSRMHVVRALGTLKRGMDRTEISKATAIGDGGDLTRILDDLENSGFIRRYRAFGKKSKGSLYQLIDQFTLFSLQFMKESAVKDERFWESYINKGGYYAWRGYAFETVCLLHLEQIKAGLGIGGVATNYSTWRSTEHDPGAQVDLVIDRSDGIIDLCEMKFTEAEYIIGKSEDLLLRNKKAAFEYEARTRKLLRLIFVSPFGVKQNTYSGIVNAQITMDDLFMSKLP
ncbi:MAG: hypothetical protein LBL27_02695 [Coriobacteriales bacterium]|jgi:AAA+ ATPase superfamily predicted ATPase|nr:hypothetical protein [Coriobacteriales bacterium]